MVRLKQSLKGPKLAFGHIFQSHNGSIKTGKVYSSFDRTENDFNPTMVRLKHTEPKQHEGDMHEFQSHNGSIKTNLEYTANDIRRRISIPQWFD